MAVPLNQDSIKLAAILQLIRNIPLLVQKQTSPNVQQVAPVIPTKPTPPPKPKDVAVKKRKSVGSSAAASTSTLKSPKLPKVPVKAPYKVTKKAAPTKQAKKKDSVVSLPLSRVRTLMKTAPEASTLSQESITVAAKAAELFIARLAQGAYHDALEKGAREVRYRHLVTSVRKHPKHLKFLFDFLPQKVLGRDILAAAQVEADSSDTCSSERQDQSDSTS